MAILKIRDENGRVHEIMALKGDRGSDGYTPQKGVDYYTEDEKTQLLESVLAALPNGDEVNY